MAPYKFLQNNNRRYYSMKTVTYIHFRFTPDYAYMHVKTPTYELIKRIPLELYPDGNVWELLEFKIK